VGERYAYLTVFVSTGVRTEEFLAGAVIRVPRGAIGGGSLTLAVGRHRNR
jgi:hypothetical protein